MLNITQMASLTGAFFKKNSPAFLTGIAVAGTITTSILAVKATPQALFLIEEEHDRKIRNGETDEHGRVTMTKLDVVKATWLCYVPAAAVCGVTIACIVGANSISTRRNAALIGAYSVTETAFREYQDKVSTHIGQDKERKIRDEIAQERITKHPNTEARIITESEMWCYDNMAGRYFVSTYETLRKCQNDINLQVMHQMYATMNDFYAMVGLKPTTMGEQFGWTTDKTLEFEFTAVLDQEGKPVLHIDYQTANVWEFSFHG